MKTHRVHLALRKGYAVNAENGYLEKEHEECMTTEKLYHAYQGSRLCLLDGDFRFGVSVYSLEREEKYIYTYDYQKEQNWTTFLEIGAYQKAEYLFERECYFRVSILKEDGNWFLESDELRSDTILAFRQTEEEPADNECIFEQEMEITVDEVLSNISEPSLVFGLLTDSHYTVNGTWETTIDNLRKVGLQVGFDAIIHMGDMTDGMLSKRMLRSNTAKVLSDLRSLNVPVYVSIGNHDTNYFKGNQEWLTAEEQYAYYLRYNDEHIYRESGSLYYYVDYEKQKVRCLFLHSFNHQEGLRYGFPIEEIGWVRRTLAETPENYCVLVFSHDAPLARLDYWASEIRNGEELVGVLEEYHSRKGHCILAYIHGHTHADYVYTERTFPIVSVGCSKVEYFPDKKPEGAVRYEREIGTVTQELWDTLIVKPKERRLEFVRFGAGENRTVYSLYGKKAELERTKVWAHRGASGYAPENTISAFQKAIEMGADGIELDVQLTKDRQLVVIHDERIDRVSDGSGLVADYTLEELRQFNYNKTHTECEHADIPTLEEVLDLMKPTGMMINIELKTGIHFYEGIERMTYELVEAKGMHNQVIYSSFNHNSVMEMRRLDATVKTGFLDNDEIYNVAAYAKNCGVTALHPNKIHLQMPGYVEACKKEGLNVHVWTINSEEEVRTMKKLKVDAVITNYPDMAKRILDEC